MPYRRVVYSCVLGVLLLAIPSVHSGLAAWEAPGQTAVSFVDAPSAEHGADAPNAPSPSILRAAGALGTATPSVPGVGFSATATPAPVADPPQAIATPAPMATVSDEPPGEAPPEPTPPAPAASVLSTNQVVVFYGYPDHPGLGVLGTYEPADAALAVRWQAAEYDRINGNDGATAMLDLVYAQAQADPTENGLYLRYLPDDVVQRYLDAAHKFDVELTLDLQIGRGDPLDEVRKIERYLRDPRVHVAIDPEYAVGPQGVPIETPGTISGAQINAIQDYVAGIVEKYNLPPKLIVVHQYLEDTVIGGEQIRSVANVDLVFNMDAFGGIAEKAERYSMFSSLGYSRYHGFNIFLRQDDRVMSAEEVLRLSPMPRVIFYQ